MVRWGWFDDGYFDLVLSIVSAAAIISLVT